MIDPIELSKQIKHNVCINNKRKYYRFRKTKFYGGCATADCIGCNLRCVYCWGQKKVWSYKFGQYYSALQVSKKLVNMNQPLIRISGGEPTICKEHLLSLINLVPKDVIFILETNGILFDEKFAKKLSRFENIYVRVSLKGVDEITFQKITGVVGKYFHYQINALKLLNKYNIKNRAALLVNLFTVDQIRSLGIPNLEFEELIEYPFVIKNLKRRGIQIIKR
ncbi:MAG: radical SAM protein [Candidatus Heimdallarchaeota archaeon]